jgi:hypothetical protein
MKTSAAVSGGSFAITVTMLLALLPARADNPNPDCLPDSVCPEWATRYDGASHLYDHAFDIVTNADGTRLYVTGASTSTAGAQDFLTIAYTTDTGEQLWEARYDGPAHGNDAPAGSSALGTAIALSRDGTRVFVTGHSADVNGKNDYVTIAYSTVDGAQLWISHYSTAQESVANALTLSGDGQRLYVTGYSALAVAAPPAPSIANYDFATVAYDAVTGQQLWVARYEGPAAFWDIPYSIAAATVQQPDGSRREQVFVTGRSNGASSANNHADFATVAYDGHNGAQLWVSRYDGPAQDRDLAYAVGASPNGSSIFITGESVGNGTSSDYATVSYDSVTGAQRWAVRYEQSDLDLALALAVSPSGNRVAVTGFSVNPNALTVIDRSAATIVYDTVTGAQVWEARHGEVDGAAASRIAFSRDGRRLYVAGLENGNVIGVGAGGVGGQVGHAPALTVAYDAVAGSEAWTVHYSGPAGDEGNSGLVISPDGGHVFVTGGGQSQGADFATLSYAGLPPLPEVPLVSVVSQKFHGAAGPFDIDLLSPIPEFLGIECRSGGAAGEYTLIFNFANTLASVGGASVASGTGNVNSSAIGSDAHQYIVDLDGVSNAQIITVSLTNVSDSSGNFSNTVDATIGFLIGDITANKVVSNTDVASVKAQVAAPVTSSNFRNDVTASGVISNTDVSDTKAQVGTQLPP